MCEDTIIEGRMDWKEYKEILRVEEEKMKELRKKVFDRLDITILFLLSVDIIVYLVVK